MVENHIVAMEKGMVAGVVMDRTRARSRPEWQQAAGNLGEQATGLLGTKPGFKGLLWFWDNDDTGDILMFGLWDGLDRRMDYEDSISTAVRALTNPLFAQSPRRPRYTLTHCYGPSQSGVVKMQVGTVAGVVMDRVRARSREDWERSAADVGEKAAEQLEKRPGFRGLQWFWDNENSGDIIMLGLWDGLDRRIGYEGSISETVRALTNPLFDQTPRRPRYTLTHCYGPP